MKLPTVAVTALAPIVWGSSYIVATEALPGWPPLAVAALRALPAGLLLLCVARSLPTGIWWWRALVLGALNFSIFWSMLFVSAYRLPGGVAAILGATQPLLVLGLSAIVLGAVPKWRQALAAILGIGGIALLLLTPVATLDPIGIAAGLAGAAAMALGVVLTRKWAPPTTLLALTAWQMIAGGLLLLPVAALAGPPPPIPDIRASIGLAYLGLIGGAATYLIWFDGIARIGPFAASGLGFFSPLTAVVLGWVFLNQTLTTPQLLGMVLTVIAIRACSAKPTAPAGPTPTGEADGRCFPADGARRVP